LSKFSQEMMEPGMFESNHALALSWSEKGNSIRCTDSSEIF
jgi:hypothetical protein